MDAWTRFWIPLAVVVGLAVGPARAQEDALKQLDDEVRKTVAEARKGLMQEIDRLLSSGEAQFADLMVKLVDSKTREKITKLEADLRARDQRIAELEAKVRELSGEKPPPVVVPAGVAFLGVGHVDPPEAVLKGLQISKGALVTQVVQGSPAEAAGLKPGDVIVALGSIEVSSADLSTRVAERKVDEAVEITYFQDGKKVTRSTKLVDREKFLAARTKPQPAPEPQKKERIVLGIRIAEKDGGLVLEEVEAGFTGNVAGLEKGDRLLQLNGKDVKLIEDVVAELQKTAEGDELSIQYARGDETIVAKVIGAHGKEGAKLLGKESSKKAAPEAPTPPPAERKPALLGVAVVPGPEGVIVESVAPDTAAAVAGIQKGDTIRQVNDTAITGIESLRDVLAKLSAGDKIRIVLSRDGQTVELKDVTLGAPGVKVEAPKSPEPPKPQEAPKPAESKPRGRLGVKASMPQDDVVSLKEVEAGGPAAAAGLQPGDIILKANGKDVRTLDELADALSGLFAGDTLNLRVRRGNSEMDVAVVLGAASP